MKSVLAFLLLAGSPWEAISAPPPSLAEASALLDANSALELEHEVAHRLLQNLPFTPQVVYVASDCSDCPPTEELLSGLSEPDVEFRSACAIPSTDTRELVGEDYASLLIEVGHPHEDSDGNLRVYGATYLYDFGSSGGYYYFTRDGSSWRFLRWKLTSIS